MGLDTTHDCWSGPYHAFMEFRVTIAGACGIDLRRMEGYGGEIRWSSLPRDPICALLHHGDCDGSIPVRDLLPLASRLEEIAPRTSGWIATAALDFARGCRRAARRREAVRFR